jgi:uncharacterized membrane protein YphA (DoxX/SURF4 family)
MFVHGGSAAAREPGKRVKLLADAGIPHPEVTVRANGAAMAAAGGMLAFGIAPRMSAAILAGSLVPTTVVGHPFWKDLLPGAAALAAGRRRRAAGRLALGGPLHRPLDLLAYPSHAARLPVAILLPVFLTSGARA